MTVEVASVSGAGSGNFTAAKASGEQRPGAYWLTIDPGTGYHGIDVFDSPNEHIKLMGGTGLFQGTSQYTGNGET